MHQLFHEIHVNTSASSLNVGLHCYILSTVRTARMQAVGLAHDGHCLIFLGAISQSVHQTACYIEEHAVDAAAGRCRHRVAGGHVDGELSSYTVDVRIGDHVW